MTIEESYKILEINNLDTSLDELKKQYKRMMLKYHPDNNNGKDDKAKEIVEAYSILKDLIKKEECLRKNCKYTTIIPFGDIIEILNGETKKIGDKVIDKSSIFRNNVYVVFSYSIAVDGISKNYSSILPISVYGVYNIVEHIEINKEVSKTAKIEVCICNKKIVITMEQYSIKIPFVIDKLNKVYINIDKILK